MKKYNVMITSDEEIAKNVADKQYVPKVTVYCQIEAFNEMLAQKYHKDGIFDHKYPRGSWIEPS